MKKLYFCVAVALVLLAEMAAGIKLQADEGSPAFYAEAFFTKPQSPDAWAMTRYGSIQELHFRRQIRGEHNL